MSISGCLNTKDLYFLIYQNLIYQNYCVSGSLKLWLC